MNEEKKEKKEEEEKVFEKVADATRYSPVSFQADIQEAEKNELVREAEEKLFLHNIEVADKFHQMSLDISIEDLFGAEVDEEQKNDEEDEKKEEA